MEYEEIKRCPICKQEFVGSYVLSKRDNKTKICSQCAAKEALVEFYRDFYNS